MNTDQIDPSKEYKPQEIVKFGWILNSKRRPDYPFVLRLIRRGLLKARVWTKTEKGVEYYLVKGQAILDYKHEIEKSI